MKTISVKNQRSVLIAFGITVFSLFILKFFFHELWKDEWQAWLLATKTHSWSELTQHLSGEGHPAFWFFLLRAWNTGIGWTGLTDVLQLQVLHFMLTVISVYVLFFKIQSPLWLKMTTVLGYFFFFEYGTLDRGYILIVLFSLCCVSLIQQNKNFRQIIWFSVFVFLLTQTEIYGTILAFSFLVFYFGEYKPQAVEFKKWIVLPLSFVAGAILFYVQVAPGTNKSADYLVFNASQKNGVVFETFQSITANTFYPGVFTTIYAAPVSPAALVAGVVLLAGIIYLFYEKRALLFAFLVCFAGMFLFTALFYTGGPRHWGNLVVFFCCLLLLYAATNTFKPLGWVVVSSILLLQMVHNMRAVADEIRYPFTNAKAAGNYIKTNVPAHVPVVGINKFFCVPVIGYSERPFYSFPEGTEYYYFKADDWQKKVYVPNARDLFLFKQYTQLPSIVVVFNHPLPLDQFPGMVQLAVFDELNVRGENYYIYKF